ncbi:MAG TPA: phosphoglycerate kinase [Patescibacteria group bacterium]
MESNSEPLVVPSLKDIDISGKRILLRFDGDVPVNIDGTLADTYRLDSVMDTILYCIDKKAQLTLLAHRGRPKGKVDPALSNQILADYIAAAVKQPVSLVTEMLGPMPATPILMLENLRFHSGEESNDTGFAKLLAKFGEIYCNDAFAVSHRAHASVSALPGLLPHVAGFQLAKELQALTPLRDYGEAPYVAILGGAKASDKSPIIADLLDKVDVVVIGGLIAVTYLAAMSQPTGAHKVDPEQVKFAQECICRMAQDDIPFVVPVDYINQHGEIKPMYALTGEELMLDIGPETVKHFDTYIHKANTVFWNGAMGKSEEPQFSRGTIGVAESIGRSGAETRVSSGGDTVGAIRNHNLQHYFTFLSTGGGASLEFLAGRELPGITALRA